MTQSRMRGADLLVRSLKVAGVTRIFSLSGNQIMPVYDACIDHGIEIIHTRHEAAAVFMAEAYAQLSEKIGVALVTAGGGIGNALGPLFTACASETPILVLSGDSPLSQDGLGSFQEMDQVSMTKPLTKLSVRPDAAGSLGTITAHAINVAISGRPGPVHMALAFDVLQADVGPQAELPEEAAFMPVLMPVEETDLQSLARRIEQAVRPLVICGPTLSPTRSGNLIKSLSDALDAPVLTLESPRGLNDPALGALGKVFSRADLIVSLGKRIDFTLNFGSGAFFDLAAKWIVVDVDEKERSRAAKNLGQDRVSIIAADPSLTAEKLAKLGAHAAMRAEWRSEAAKQISFRSFAPSGTGTTGPIRSADLCSAVQRCIEAEEHSVAVIDGGEFGQWGQAILEAEARVVNGVSGVIGGGLCYGFAAKLARPNAKVFSLMGDGSAGFHFAEFETAARYGIPCVVVIGNDQRWNAEHQIQLRNYGPDRLIGCDLSAARYDLAAIGLGAHGEYVTDLSQLDEALTRASASGKPACVNVVISGEPAPTGAGH